MVYGSTSTVPPPKDVFLFERCINKERPTKEIKHHPMHKVCDGRGGEVKAN
jgi:hypothetical protein